MKSLRQIGLAGLAGLVLAGYPLGQAQAETNKAPERQKPAVTLPAECVKVVSLGVSSYGYELAGYVSCELADGSIALWEFWDNTSIDDTRKRIRWEKKGRYQLSPFAGEDVGDKGRPEYKPADEPAPCSSGSGYFIRPGIRR